MTLPSIARFSFLERDLTARAPLLILVAAMTVLTTAIVFQYGLELLPCVLCLWQRVPYLLAIPLAILALFRPPGSPLRTLALALCALAFVLGAGTAIYHVGVEQHWWSGTSGCGAPPVGTLTAAELRAQILAAPVVRCDVVVWSLFGISMAGYNVPVSLALALLAGLAARTGWRHR